MQSIEFSTKNDRSDILPKLFIWTDASILSYVQRLSFAKNLIPDICNI